MKNKAEAQLEQDIRQMIHIHGLVNVIKAIATSCDTSADFFVQCNERKLEDYWRGAAVAILDTIKRVGDLPEKSKKY